MDTRETLIRLRSELKMTQKQAALATSISLRSWLRYESGQYEPGPRDYKKLSELAKAQHLPFLQAIFEGKFQSQIIADAEATQRRLRSPGSARTIPFDRLTDWAHDAEQIRDSWEAVVKTLRRIQKQLTTNDIQSSVKVDLGAIEEIAVTGMGVAENLKDRIQLYTVSPAPKVSRRIAALRLKEGLQNLREQFGPPTQPKPAKRAGKKVK